MKRANAIIEDITEMDNLMSVCCGNPQGDELPQVASAEDILIDVYSDILNAPRQSAAAHFHHQDTGVYDGYDDYMIH